MSALKVALAEPELVEKQTLLEIQGVSLVYQSSRGPFVALSDLDLTVSRGEFVSILGPSGCGKSTLLSLIAGLIPATKGTLSVLGRKITGPRPDIGVVFQRPTLLPWATVIDNVLIPIRALSRPVKQYRARAHEVLDLVGLADFAESYPGELSGGMQQRVGIARALIHDPELLLMDEPFAALDAMTRERMTVEVQEIWRRTGKTVILITHSISEAVISSNRVFLMSGSPGRIMQEMPIGLPQPRTIEELASARFGQLCGSLRHAFDHFSAASGRSGK